MSEITEGEIVADANDWKELVEAEEGKIAEQHEADRAMVLVQITSQINICLKNNEFGEALALIKVLEASRGIDEELSEELKAVRGEIESKLGLTKTEELN